MVVLWNTEISILLELRMGMLLCPNQDFLYKRTFLGWDVRYHLRTGPDVRRSPGASPRGVWAHRVKKIKWDCLLSTSVCSCSCWFSFQSAPISSNCVHFSVANTVSDRSIEPLRRWAALGETTSQVPPAAGCEGWPNSKCGAWAWFSWIRFGSPLHVSCLEAEDSILKK